MKTNNYPTDLTNAQWDIIQPLLPKRKGAGRPPVVDFRQIINAILYVSRSGCQYRMLPHDFPPWQTVYYYIRKWQSDGTWKAIHDALADAVREKERPKPRTTASVDSQSTDSAGAVEARGYDGGKKLEGRKRHIVVDSLGLLLAVVVTAGNISDAKGGAACLGKMDPEDFPSMKTIFADRAYEREGFPQRVEEWKPGCSVHIVSRPEGSVGFVKLAIRWVVERTNAWLTKNRRLCRSYEHTVASESAYVRIALIHRMLRRLSPSKPQHPYKFRLKN